jgi:GNAT superfamily N-acetyltransferase
MSRTIRLANEDELPAMHAILTLCGEAMHRIQGLSHWYPYGSFEEFRQRVGIGKVYGLYEDEFLVGTFCLSVSIPPYYFYPQIAWGNPEAKALYFSKFGILPVLQKRGLGSWTMNVVDKLVEGDGYEALRFDAVSRNKSLIRFYENLGYERRATIDDSSGNPIAICYERVF